jgi:DNA-directed RNA polymerase subunit M/transcription elongation factor TFIIS
MSCTNITKLQMIKDMFIRQNFSEVTSTHKDKWTKNMLRHMKHFSFSVNQHQIKLIEHYLTVEHVMNGIIPYDQDTQTIKALYIQNTTQRNTNLTNNLLQEPLQTYGEDVKCTLCPKCKKTNTTGICIQKRSSDEPPAYQFQCLESGCGHTWQFG